MEEITVTREELYREVWKQPLSVVARKYMQSESSFRTICIDMSIPVPREGHWEKIRLGMRIDIPALSKNYQGLATIILKRREQKHRKQKELANNSVETKANTPAVKTAPTSNLPTDKLVISAGKALRSKENNRYDGMAYCPQGELNIRVTPMLVGRALAFMDAMIKAARARGHDIVVRSNKTCVVVFQQELEIHCREKTNRVAINTSKWPSHAFHPSGLLILKLEGLHGREWIDGTKLIDEQIPSMLDKFEIEARREIEWEERVEKSRLEREEHQRLEKEREQNRSRELAASRILLQRALRWERSLALRRYLAELRDRATAGGATLSDEMIDYLEWAAKKADWYDPFINAIDDLLSDKDKEIIEQPAEKKSSTFGFADLGDSNSSDYYSGKPWYLK